MPQALGGWALVLRYGSAIGPCDDRTALPEDPPSEAACHAWLIRTRRAAL